MESELKIPDIVSLAFVPGIPGPDDDPAETAATRQIFLDDTARTFYLAWRCCHITSQYFVPDVQAISKRIRETQPKTAADLVACFRGVSFGHFDFTRPDIETWSRAALPFFTGERKIGYRIEMDERKAQRRIELGPAPETLPARKPRRKPKGKRVRLQVALGGYWFTCEQELASGDGLDELVASVHRKIVGGKESAALSYQGGGEDDGIPPGLATHNSLENLGDHSKRTPIPDHSIVLVRDVNGADFEVRLDHGLLLIRANHPGHIVVHPDCSNVVRITAHNP